MPTTTDAINQTNQGGYDLFLTIMDPNATKLVYSTYIGGSSDDKLWDFQFDNDGNIILTGETSSTNFPATIDAANTMLSGESDAFLLKLGPDGTSIRYSTFIGGVYPDVAYSVAVDGDNDCYVAGYTKSVDFPTTVGAFNRTLGGEYDGFVTKINSSSGAMEYSTYIGGEDETTSLFDFEHISDIAVSSKGAVFATGLTRSYDFPTTPNAFDTVSDRYSGTAFALKLSPDGGSLRYSTFLQSPRDGGSRGYSLVLVDDKYAIVGGTTSLKDYPVTFGAYNGSDDSGSGKDDIFITKLDEDGRFLKFSGLIGGRDDERVHDIVVDDLSNIIITGFTKSDDLPLTECCYSDSLLGYDDAILIKFDPNLTSLLYSTYIGGTDNEYGTALATNALGQAFLVGMTNGRAFPTTAGAFDTTWNGGYRDCIVMKLDITPPTIERDDSDTSATTGDGFLYNISARDNDAVGAVDVIYRFGASDETSVLSLESSTEDTVWNGSLLMPEDSLSPLHYVINLTDAWGNWFESDEVTIGVTDDDLPILVDLTPPNATTGDPMGIKVDVTDNIGIGEVRVIHRQGSRAEENASLVGTNLTGLGNGTYQAHNIILPDDSTLPVIYRIYAMDISGNWIVGPEVTLAVIDDDPPLVTILGPEGGVTTGETLNFTADVKDNIGVKRVSLTRWFGTSNPVVVEMEPKMVTGLGNGTYHLGFTIPSDAREPLSYFVTAIDLHGLVSDTTVRVLVTEDDDPPIISSDGTTAIPTTGDPFVFRVEVFDNVAVSNVTCEYSLWNDDPVIVDMNIEIPEENGTGWYTYNIGIPEAQTGSITYTFKVSDLANNTATSREVIKDVIDNDLPVFGSDTTVENGTNGLSHTFAIIVEDNWGVLDVWLALELPGHPDQNLSMEGPFSMSESPVFKKEVLIPLDSHEQVIYHFYAEDPSGNWNVTTPATVTLSNPPPVISEVPTWDVVEEATSTLDLEPYISDPNHPVEMLSLSVNDPNITVDRLVLTAFYNDWTETHAIQVGLTDGDLTIHTNITVRIENVNDPPTGVSILQPEDGTTYLFGDNITFQVEFQDKDVEAGQVIDVTWRSDISGVFREQTSLDLSEFTIGMLPRGTHTIEVEVDDGVNSATSIVVITIQGKDDSQNGDDGFPWIIIIVMVAVAAVVGVTITIMRKRGIISQE